MPAIPSICILLHRRHPSRLPCGSLRSALTGPAGDARALPEMREWQDLFWQAEAELAAVEAHTERRILLRSMRSQSACLVRGSSRRIMTVRSRPAYIRVINRRCSAFNCHLLCFQNKNAGSWINSPRAGPKHQPRSGLDRSLHIRTGTSALVASSAAAPPPECGRSSARPDPLPASRNWRDSRG